MRTVVETLHGYSFFVQKAQVPVDAQAGQNGAGAETMELTILSFVDQGSPHRVDVPLPEAARVALVEALTGGITIARGGL